MENGGNAKVNAIFEARLNVEKPSNLADLNTRERFIRDKYERRKFYDPAAFQELQAAPPPKPNPPTTGQQPAPRTQPDMDMPTLSSAHNTSANMGAPSAAARKRLESRKSSFESTSSTAARARGGVAPAPVAKPRSKSVAPEGDLLDFNSSSESLGRKGPKKKTSDLMGFPDDSKSTEDKSKQTRRPTTQSQDPFADFAAASGSSSNSGDFGDFASAIPNPTTPSKPKTPTPSSAAQNIMSLYNTNPGHPQPFSANNGVGTSSMNNNSNMNNSMANMTSIMQQMNMQNGGMQSSQMQQQAMMYQQHMMMLQVQRQQNSMPLGGMFSQTNMMMNSANNNANAGGGAGGGMTMQPMTMIRQQAPQQQPAMQSVNASAAGAGQPSKNEAADPFASLSGSGF